MANKKNSGSTSLASVRREAHGTIHNWLYDHRRSILRIVAAEGEVPTWEPFIKLMTAAGITAADGSALTTARVRRRWFDVAARIEKEAQAKASAPPKRPRCYKKNVEPPSRPPPPDTGIRYPSWMTEETPGFRERHPEIYGAPRASSPPAGASQNVNIPLGLTPEAAEQLASAQRDLAAVDGYQPPIRKMGRII